MRLLLNVDPNAVFSVSSLNKNYTNYYQPFIDFGLQFFNGSGFLDGDNYPNLVTSVVTFEESIFEFIDQFEIYRTNRSDSTAELLTVYSLADLFFEFYPINQFTFALKDQFTAQVDTYNQIFSVPMEIFFNVLYNYRYIFQYLSSIVNCSFSLDLDCTGYNVGLLLKKILLKY
jgi:hypothetical protein